MRRSNIDISVVIFIAIVLGSAAGMFGAFYYFKINVRSQVFKEAQELQEVARNVPVLTVSSTPDQAPEKTETTTSTPVIKTVVGAFNLDIAFFPQAPKKVWDAAHEDYCEEASLLGVHAFLQNKKFSLDEMDAELEKMRVWEVAQFGYFESTSLEQTARIAREYLGYKKVRIIENPTIEMIRAEVSAGRPVIVPANGKLLKNPYFKNGGPVFHMYTVRGFTEKGGVIVNDPGTQHGENFVYSPENVLSSMHDWNHAQDITMVASGEPRVLVIE